jgi:hypothetical protein
LRHHTDARRISRAEGDFRPTLAKRNEPTVDGPAAVAGAPSTASRKGDRVQRPPKTAAERDKVIQEHMSLALARDALDLREFGAFRLVLDCVNVYVALRRLRRHLQLAGRAAYFTPAHEHALRAHRRCYGVLYRFGFEIAVRRGALPRTVPSKLSSSASSSASAPRRVGQGTSAGSGESRGRGGGGDAGGGGGPGSGGGGRGGGRRGGGGQSGVAAGTKMAARSGAAGNSSSGSRGSGRPRLSLPQGWLRPVLDSLERAGHDLLRVGSEAFTEAKRSARPLHKMGLEIPLPTAAAAPHPETEGAGATPSDTVNRKGAGKVKAAQHGTPATTSVAAALDESGGEADEEKAHGGRGLGDPVDALGGQTRVPTNGIAGSGESPTARGAESGAIGVGDAQPFQRSGVRPVGGVRAGEEEEAKMTTTWRPRVASFQGWAQSKLVSELRRAAAGAMTNGYDALSREGRRSAPYGGFALPFRASPVPGH